MRPDPRAPLPPKFVRPLRLLLYVLLLAAAAVSLTGLPALEQAVREGRRSPATLMIAPGLLAVFVAVFAVYRFTLVRAGRYHAGKAFVHVGVMILALSLLLPGSLERYRSAGTVRPVDLSRHLASPDAEARAMAAELARHRELSDAVRYVPRLVELSEDSSPEVRRQARVTLVTLAGRDAGGEGPGSAERWREFWKARGVHFADR